MRILPINRKVSKDVTEITDQIKKDIKGMREMIEANKFDNKRGGFAVAHCQVSDDPYKIFVAIKKIFPHDVIINPKIVEKNGQYQTTEMCLSFPFRPAARVKRYESVKVTYQDEKLETYNIEFQGLQAQIIQHEIQHFTGNNIYNK